MFCLLLQHHLEMTSPDLTTQFDTQIVSQLHMIFGLCARVVAQPAQIDKTSIANTNIIYPPDVYCATCGKFTYQSIHHFPTRRVSVFSYSFSSREDAAFHSHLAENLNTHGTRARVDLVTFYNLCKNQNGVARQRDDFFFV